MIDADRVAREAGMGNRINTVMQPCFFQLSGVLPRRRGDRQHQGVRREDLREARRGVVQRNFAAIDRSLERLRTTCRRPSRRRAWIDAAGRPTTRPTSSSEVTAR